MDEIFWIICVAPALLIIGLILFIRWLIFGGKWRREDERKEAAWGQLRTGMTKEEVEELLGQPEKISEPTLLRTVT